MAGSEQALAREPGEAAAPEKPKTDWWAEAKGIFWLIVAVLVFHTFVAKPFYIPSESMLPGLEVGDRLVVTKYPYGWSYISPTFHVLPFLHGRLLGHLPERGDIAIVTPPGRHDDLIKRVIGLPGDRIELRDGTPIINGVAVQRGPVHFVDLADYGGIPTKDGPTCNDAVYPGALQHRRDGTTFCRLPIVTETLPNGRRYDTVAMNKGYAADNFGPVTVPADHVFLMGDNRDNSADSRVPLVEGGLGGPVPWENLGGRAEFITFSLDGTASWNPLTWWGSLRPGRAGTSLHPEETRR